MALYFRKSIKAGPFRFKLSKSGIGMSAGVRGFRVGTGPKGHYIHAGVNGLYYQRKFSSKKPLPIRKVHFTSENEENDTYETPDGIRMLSIDSEDISILNSASSDEIVNDLNEKTAQFKMSIVLPVIFLLPSIAVAALAKEIPLLFWLSAAVTVASAFAGRWYDEYARTSVLMYDFDETTYRNYGAVRAAFNHMKNASKVWHIPSAGKVETLVQWKKNSGANTIVDRKLISLNYGLPPTMKSNIEVPSIPVGKQIIYFFPDRIILKQGNRYRGIGYNEVVLKTQHSRFIESDGVPPDSQTVGETWKYVNKKGGPDKRFNDNRILPICLYEDMLFHSGAELRELIELSNVGPLEEFKVALAKLKNFTLDGLE